MHSINLQYSRVTVSPGNQYTGTTIVTLSPGDAALRESAEHT